MNMNNFSVDKGDRTMLSSFRLIDLETLLGTFGLNTSGEKSELIDRALELLRTRPAYINIPAYIAKIYEIYRSLNLPTDDSGIILRSLLQKPSKRIYQPPQYPQQSTYMAQAVAQIKFKKLPFYEVIDEVIKPTLLTGTDRCTLLNVSRGMKEAQFKHTLSFEHVNLVATNRDISHGKNEYQFQIRICQLIEPVPNESPDYMPLGLHIRVNMKACPLPPIPPNARPNNLTESRRTARPINCTANVKLSPINVNNITINWTPDGKNYVFVMYLVKKLTVDTLIKKLQDKGGRSSEDTKNYIISKVADVDPDLATNTSYRFSLVCPLGKMRMKIPAKSINCDHLQCFDASTFILMNEKKPTWMCPTCNKPCLYDDIQIENYFLEVLSSSTLNSWSKEIEILADGTWKAFEETKNTSSSHNKVKHIDCVDLDSDDEEPPRKRDKRENEAQAADASQLVAVVDLKSQAQVQPQQAGTSSEQGVVIEID